MLRTLATLALFAAAPASAGVITDWSAAQGLPSSVSPAWTLAGPAPSITGGAMRLAPTAYWYQDQATVPGFDTVRAFSISARMRHVSGSTANDSREGAALFVTQGGGYGGVLFIGAGRIFLNADNLVRGATLQADTSNWHTYRMDFAAPVNNIAAITVSRDGIPVLSGSTFYSLPANGTDKSVYFGDISFLADATSEWRFVRNSAVPEPAAWALLIVGFGLVGAAARRAPARVAARRGFRSVAA